MFSRLWASRHLVATLTRRAYQIRYRQSFVGYFWAVIPPLGILLVGSVVFDRVAGLGSERGSYALVTMAAVIPWSFFASSLAAGIPVIYSSQSMITRLAFPRAALPIAAVSTSLIGLAISCLLFVAIAVMDGSGIPLTALWFPALLMLEVIFIVGIVLLGSALDVFARDMRLALPIVVQLWMLLTPVMYSLESVDSLRSWYLANPMTGVVESFRRVLVFGQAPDIGLLMPTIIGAVAAFVIGVWYFTATEPRFADAI